MEDPELHARPVPTPARPLLGLTLLLVDDSRYASEAIRLLALRSGARIRRADTLRAARRHLGTYRPDLLLVDLGLPDGSGLELIAEVARAATRPMAVVGTSGRLDAESRSDVTLAGADGFLPKPVESLRAFQDAMLQHLPEDLRPRRRHLVPVDAIQPDRLALSEDLAFLDRALEEGQPADYVVDFLKGLARTGHDDRLLAATRELSAGRPEDIRPHLRALISERLDRERRAV